MTERKLVAVLACRNSGSRLYGKPLQRLNIESGWHILDQVIANVRASPSIDKVILAISSGNDNTSFVDYAESHHIESILGDPIDVLSRLICGLDQADGTDLFRVTTESPFLYWQAVEKAWETHKAKANDATFMDEIIDGCGFEIITADALKVSWQQGNSKHRSELCSLYIRENPQLFRVQKLEYPNNYLRKDLRLTVDYPEDLIVCRKVYNRFRQEMDSVSYSLDEIIGFLDESPSLRALTMPFTEAGYSSMYL
jgi:spore coat polysaccharide biosynthesis protein SpsF